jgi:TPR repeat protein
MELRANLALTPDDIPEPRLRQPRGSLPGMAGRFVMVAALAVAGAYGFMWLSDAPIALSEPQSALADSDGVAADAHVSVALAEASVAEPKADRAPPPGGAAPYSVADYARDLADGAPVMPAAVLAPKPVSVPPLSGGARPEPGEIAALLARSRAYLAAGDVAAARLVLRRAVDGGDSQAALALGSTYDPIALKERGVISFAGDPAQAREWYRRAVELGSTDASQRIEQLAQVDR